MPFRIPTSALYMYERILVSCSEFSRGCPEECLPSSLLSPEIFLVSVWVSFSNRLLLTVPGTLNEQVEPRQAIAVKLCHAHFICMTHPPRKPEAQSVINFPSVFQFCHWHSFSFQLWKLLHCQVQSLSENMWGRCPQMSSWPRSWHSTVLLPLYQHRHPKLLGALCDVADGILCS